MISVSKLSHEMTIEWVLTGGQPNWGIHISVDEDHGEETAVRVRVVIRYGIYVLSRLRVAPWVQQIEDLYTHSYMTASRGPHCVVLGC